jgi:DMSO/TMAO reductase YedYZ molybdopterin-dependent catalytic subunit
MNGEPLPPDHGFPARLIVSGWCGAASIKWIGSIEVSNRRLYSHWNTVEYVLAGPAYAMHYPALGPMITEMPVMSMLELDWPARVVAGERTIRGRSFAGESQIRHVVYSVDGAPWQNAELIDPGMEACWTRWQFPWRAEAGYHEVRVRATDARGRTQPDGVPWNHHGYLYNAVVAHPVQVE